MKIVATSNFNDESVAEFVVAENIQLQVYADAMCRGLNDFQSGRYYFVPKPDDYVLWRGMEDLVR